MLIKTWFYVKIAKNWILRHNLLMFFFLGMFCKLGFCILQNQKTWNSQVTLPEMSNRGAWPEWLKPPYIYGTHWHNITKRALALSKIPPDKNGTQHKWHLTKMSSHKNGISKLTLLIFRCITNNLLIKPTPTITHRLEKLDFKIPWPWVSVILQI